MIKKVLKWIGIAFIVLIVLGFIFGDDAQPTSAPANPPAASSQPEPSKEQPKVAETAPAPETKVVVPTVTVSQNQAVKKAKAYLGFSSFSKEGLIKQLEFEGFTTEDATYGASNSGADWMQQAVKKAKAYLDYSSFSKNGLIEQLKFEGFTQEQAEFGVLATGL